MGLLNKIDTRNEVTQRGGKLCEYVLNPGIANIEGRTEEGETVQETFRVTKEVYDAVEIGFEFVYQEDMEPEEPEYTREKQPSQDAG